MKPEYRDLSEKEIIKTFSKSILTEGLVNLTYYDIQAIRAVIAADRALQLKPKTVKCRLYSNDGKIGCATEDGCFLESGAFCWIGPVFEREID